MVLVGVRRQCREDRRIDLAGFGWRQRLVAEIHQRVVGVVVQEFLDVLGQADAVIERLGLLRLVVVEFEQQIEGEVLDLLALGFG
ncbi:hypothetical protein EV561_1649 [Rhizobium sp. BK376]|nr:hypothetical protein EV561_1649 [Rhizobium sp. BK376]